MTKVPLTPIANLQNENTAVNAINANSVAITTAFDNTLSRDGTTPNTMGSNLDMNSYEILNLPAPTSNYEPLRLIDANTIKTGGTITVSPLPSGGATNQVLSKNSSTNYDVSWKTPSSSSTLPVGGTTGQVLAKTSNTDYAVAWSTKQPFPTGGTAGQTLIKKSGTDYDTIWNTSTYVTPEMFGATVGSSGNATAGLQAAINSLAGTGGTVKLGLGTYVINGPITITTQGITIEGSSMDASIGTRIQFTPLGNDQACFEIGNGAAILSDVQLRNFAIATSNTANYKTAIRVRDGSVVQMERVYIRSFLGGATAAVTGAVASPSGEIRLSISVNPSTIYNDGYSVAVSGVTGTTEANSGWPIAVVSGTQIDLKGSTFTNAYVSGGSVVSTSQGIQLKGRELYSMKDVLIGADLAMRFSVNPNFSSYALDESNFQNITLSSTSTSPNLMIDDGVSLTSISFDGVQSWGGGKNGVQWRDKTSSSISEQIIFNNVRAEQTSVAGGWYFDLFPNNIVYSFVINNLLVADRNGIRARNIANLALINPHFLGATNCLDINSTVQNTSINGSYAIAGSSSTLTGQNVIYQTANNTGGGLPSFAQYSSASAPPQVQAGLVVGAGALATSATSGFFYVNTTAGTPSGVPSAFTGRSPLLYDTTANKLWVYNGSWRSVTLT